MTDSLALFLRRIPPGGGSKSYETVWVSEAGAHCLAHLCEYGLVADPLAPYPVGSVYLGTAGSPTSLFGGTWVDRGHPPTFHQATWWERTA